MLRQSSFIEDQMNAAEAQASGIGYSPPSPEEAEAAVAAAAGAGSDGALLLLRESLRRYDDDSHRHKLHGVRLEDMLLLRHVHACGCGSIVAGNIVGSGGFSDVYEAHRRASRSPFRRRSSDDTDMCTDITSGRSDDEEGSGLCCDENALVGDGEKACMPRHPQKEQFFVIKHLKKECLVAADPKALERGVARLAAEAAVLSTLGRHSNVVEFHGVFIGGGLLLERLRCTLTERMAEWSAETRRHRRRSRGRRALLSMMSLGNKLTRREASSSSSRGWDQHLLQMRLCAALDVARGLSHLHRRNVMHRDLKPDNVGFAFDGTAKIFDFDIAKVDSPAMYRRSRKRHTGLLGTARYMAPEVARCKSYGLSADVYSFGLLLWAVCSMRRPWEHLSGCQVRERVVKEVEEEVRPRILSCWGEGVRDLTSRCWAADPNLRPVAKDVVLALEEEVASGEREACALPPTACTAMEAFDTHSEEGTRQSRFPRKASPLIAKLTRKQKQKKEFKS